MTPGFFCTRYRVALFLFPLLSLFFLLLPACAGKNRPITKLFTPAEGAKVSRVAIFPFSDAHASTELALKTERIFFSELVNSALFEVVPEGDVKLFFRRNRIIPGTVFTTPQLATVHSQLAVDAVIIGRINEAGRSGGRGRNAGNFISLQLEIVDTRTGKKLATTFLRRAGSDYKKIIHFGMVATESGLLGHMAREIFAEWRRQGLGGC